MLRRWQKKAELMASGETSRECGREGIRRQSMITPFYLLQCWKWYFLGLVAGTRGLGFLME